MEEAIIIGAFDFIGYNLLNKLLNDGVVVHGVDIELSEQASDLKEEKILAIGRNANFNYIEDNEWESLQEVDTLFYCVDVTGGEDLARAEDLLKEAIQYCQSTSTSLIFASTLEVVDHRTHEKITENTPSLPVNERGRVYAKLEDLLRSEYKKKSFAYLLLRLPTLYGPWQPERFAYHQLLQNEHKHGETWDEYKGDVLFIDDAVEALVQAGISESRSEIIHITTGKVDEWAKGIAYIINKSNKQRGENTITLSSEKAQELLSFSPSVSIQEGIEKQKEFIHTLTKDIGRN
ncbi:NAD-dependent epimerase/dehydratase family protein [Bacillus pinisoli]|uniref:NAD-dependent epimerase/dehydratase family protein n=1 Tax=Bacillus pinisoli TaxID=2901866 RepID=UPI001FF0EB24|nr:NAD(P)-dependent oxidoreductase [Bacillus pinisoli]